MGMILMGIAALAIGKIIGALHVDSPQERRWKQLKNNMIGR